MNNNDCLESIRCGNRETLLLIEKWSSQIAYSSYYSIPVEQRHDIVQDVLLKIYELACNPDFYIKVSMKAIVRKITISRCIDWIRQQRPMVQDFDQFLTSKDNPYQNVLSKENINIIHWALMSLRESCKTLISRHFLDEISYKEIAVEDNIAISTVRVKMSRCIKILRKIFRQKQIEL
jgi:RNA polymerase sigma factor (sigma-70 family)